MIDQYLSLNTDRIARGLPPVSFAEFGRVASVPVGDLIDAARKRGALLVVCPDGEAGAIRPEDEDAYRRIMFRTRPYVREDAGDGTNSAT